MEGVKLKNLYVVSYAFLPYKSMATVRNYYLAKGFSNYFSRTEVISTSNCLFLPKEESIGNDLKTYYVPTFDYRTVFNSKKTSGVTELPNDKKSYLRKLKNSFPYLIVFGLGGIVYILLAYIFLFFKLLFQDKREVVLLSTFKPYSNHLIAFLLKCTFRKIYWIADFQNLHIDPDHKRLLHPKFQKMMNKRILKTANKIIVVSPGLIPPLADFNNNISVVELGINEIPSQNAVELNDKFTFSYTGSIYSSQKFDLLFSVMNRLMNDKVINRNDILFRYAGASIDLWNKAVNDYKLDDISESLGIISIDQARVLQSRSHVNLLLTWNTPKLKGIIPGKFYDYLIANRPFFLFVSGAKDLIWEEKMKELESNFMYYDNEESADKLYQILFTMFSDWKNGINPVSLDYSDIIQETYLIDRICHDFIKQEF